MSRLELAGSSCCGSVFCAERTLANSDVQMGSTSATFAAVIRVWSLSDCDNVSSRRRSERTATGDD